jgi:putative FmdB family regulatory protein
MPIYEYEPLSGECPFCRGRFEELQDANDPPYENCPSCDVPCKRVISRPNVKRHDRAQSGVLSKENIERQGFVRYEKAGHGVWERTAGSDAQGPRILKKDGSTSEG